MSASEPWDLRDAQGLLDAARGMQQEIDEGIDNARWATDARSILVIDKTNRRAIRVAGSASESSIKFVLAAIGWRFVDRANGEAVDET